MEQNKMKNMIVLKDLPSNIIDEAFVILKPNKIIKHTDSINKNVEDKQVVTKYGAREYMVREAELVISDYLSNVEKNKFAGTLGISKLEKKYKRMKALVYILGITTVLSAFLQII